MQERQKRVYICSPYSSQGDREENVIRAMGYCAMAIEKGYTPIAPHVFYTPYLNDDIAEHREFGLKVGMDLLTIRDEIWVFGQAAGGMCNEIMAAGYIGIPVRFFAREGI